MAVSIIQARKILKFASRDVSASRNRGNPTSELEISTHMRGADSSHAPDGSTQMNGSPNQSNGSKLGECMEQAQILKSELERMRSGVRLLGDSVERLNRAVQRDNRCCWGVFDLIQANVRMIGSSWLEGDRTQSTYSSVRTMDESAHG
jgi:hypothetical protein